MGKGFLKYLHSFLQIKDLNKSKNVVHKSRVIIMATESKTAESEVGGGETESESDSNLLSRCELWVIFSIDLATDEIGL